MRVIITIIDTRAKIAQLSIAQLGSRATACVVAAAGGGTAGAAGVATSVSATTGATGSCRVAWRSGPLRPPDASAARRLHGNNRGATSERTG